MKKKGLNEMNDNAEIQNAIRQRRFIENNGKVLRTINSLRYRYVSLKDLSYGLEPSMTVSELLDCVNYLTLRGYIITRHVRSKASVTIADAPFEELEAKLSADGISLLSGTRTDDNVDV